MQVVQHNLLSQFTSRQLNLTTGKKGKSTEKLSSGYRINRSADDAAGLGISEKMRWQIRGLGRGQQNTQDGISWLQVGDGAMGEIEDMLHRISELATQASNDTNTDSDRFQINEEIKHLKKEINRIGNTTEFNTQDVFDNSYVQLEISGSPGDMKIFDASYDDLTGDVTFGGFIFNGTRVPWSDVNSDLAYIDTDTGKQMFHAGDYTYTDQTGQTYMLHAKDGAEIPDIERVFSIHADAATGLSIDGGTPIPWSSFFDEDGEALSAGNVHGGAWAVDYLGCELNFMIPDHVETLDDLAKCINSMQSGDNKVQYTWKTAYTGNSAEKAVDATAIQDLRISNALASTMVNVSDYSLTVRADETGVWLDDRDGNGIDGSKKTWDELGVTDTANGETFFKGSTINSTATYTYSDTEGINDTNLEFTIKLSDITSVDSIVDGLDGMKITASNIRNNYSSSAAVATNGNILKGSTRVNIDVPYGWELDLGRNFDVRTGDLAQGTGSYDAAVQKADLVLTADTTGIGSGTGTKTLSGSTTDAESRIVSDVNKYLAQVEKEKTRLAIAGVDPQASYGSVVTDLKELLGTDKITSSGWMDEKIEILDGMPTTGVVAGKSYAGASIDFSEIGNGISLDSLDGLGFNSTCRTCSNHYSIQFSSSIEGGSEKNGYRYEKIAQGGQNYLLNIDISSLKENGVTDGADLAKAIVEIADGGVFDFHYTQYAADGAKLYVIDERYSAYGADPSKSVPNNYDEGIFDTKPWKSTHEGTYSIDLSDAEGNFALLSYDYDFMDTANGISEVTMQSASAGAYVYTNGTDASEGYTLYDSENSVHEDLERFDVTYKYKDQSGNYVDKATAEADYASNAVKTMLENTTGKLHANDFTYADLAGNENANVAIRANYESYLEESPYENGIHIQNSSNVGDYHVIPRFPMNTVFLGINRADVRTYEGAQKTMEYARLAVDKLNEKRGIYGAYQNRLEHTLMYSANAEEQQQAAESRLRDTDMAKEMVSYSIHNMLAQVGQTMLVQANQSPQGILSLLQ